MRLQALLLNTSFVCLLLGTVRADTTISVTARKGANRVYLPAGTVKVNFTPVILRDYVDEGVAPPDVSGSVQIVAKGETGPEIILVNYAVPGSGSALPGVLNLPVGKAPSGTTSFGNPIGQYYEFFEQGGITIGHSGVRSTAGGFFTLEPDLGQTEVTGVPPRPAPPPGNGGGRGPGTTIRPHNIHALIVSGQSDPSKVLTSGNTVLNGGIVVLGTVPPTPGNRWTPGLRIVPDSNLIQGIEVPPIVPSLIDVRITNFQTSADLP